MEKTDLASVNKLTEESLSTYIFTPILKSRISNSIQYVDSCKYVFLVCLSHLSGLKVIQGSFEWSDFE